MVMVWYMGVRSHTNTAPKDIVYYVVSVGNYADLGNALAI